MKGKGTIMEIREKSMVIMTSDCGFEEIKRRNNVMVGMEIEITTKDILKRKPSYFKPLTTVAAAIILMIISTLFILPNFTAEATAVAMVTIDINPSIGLELNHKQEVVKLLTLNEDAERLPIPDVKGKNVRVAIQEIMAVVEGEGYLQEDDNYVLLTTVSLEKEADEDEELIILAEELKTSIENNAQQKEQKNVVVLTLDSSYETLMKAQQEKTSVGKMEFYQRLEAEEDDENLKLDEIKTKKVKELVEVAEKKAHPVFDQHPSKKVDKEQSTKNNPGNQKKEESTQKDNGRNKTEKQHPVFDQHPGKNQEQEQPLSKDDQKQEKFEEKKNKKDEKKSDVDKKNSDEDREKEKKAQGNKQKNNE